MRKIKPLNLLIVLFGFVLVVGFIVFGISRLFVQDVEYDTSLFVLNNQEMTYNDDSYMTYFGIDVSDHQSEIDWKSVKNSGVDFAMIRCGYRGGIEGLMHEDAYFDYNMKHAIKNDIDVGVYFYSSAISIEEVQEEASFVLDKLDGYTIKYPIVFDMEIYDENEGRINNLTKEEKTNIALEFCEEIEKAGYTPMIYGNINWLYEQLDFESISKYDIWYAAYQDTPSIEYPFTMWQYTNAGQIDGISTYVDLNIWIERK